MDIALNRRDHNKVNLFALIFRYKAVLRKMKGLTRYCRQTRFRLTGTSAQTQGPPCVLRPAEDVLAVEGLNDPVVHNNISLAHHCLHVRIAHGICKVGDHVLGKEWAQVGGFAVNDHEIGILPDLDRTQ